MAEALEVKPSVLNLVEYGWECYQGKLICGKNNSHGVQI